ncbi:flagellar biosynthesis anti-sigma factor FlgM [uncultured Tolumonas sp.]
MRLEKVDALKAQLASDQYHPDGDSVARGLVKEHMPPAES